MCEGYGRMGMMGHLGQMGQMMKRNGNVFQMLPIKKKWENVGILPKQWGRFLQNPTYIFLLFLQEKKKGIKNGQIGRKFPYGGGRGRGLPYFFLLLN